MVVVADPPCCFNVDVGVVDGACSLVLTKSNGWNKTVEQNPEIDPDRNDLNTGCAANLT